MYFTETARQAAADFTVTEGRSCSNSFVAQSHGARGRALVSLVGHGVPVGFNTEHSAQATTEVFVATEVDLAGGRTVASNGAHGVAFVVDALIASIKDTVNAELCESRSGSQGSQCN